MGCLLLLASCGGDDSSEVPPPKTEVTLSVAPADLTYDPASPSSNVVTVTTNASWKAECPDSKLKFSPSSGTGNATIAFTDAPAGVRCTLTVTAGTGADAKKQTVEIFREADVPVQTVFSLDFGNGTNGVWAGSNDEWKTQTGTGASTVTYSVNNVRINNDNFGSAGKYTGASGKAYAKMFYDASTDYFTIHDITLPEGERNYTLTFGTIFPAADVSLMVSADGAVWRPLAYTGASAYNTWAKATVGFTLKQAVAKLSIRLAPTGTERTYGLNFDDIVLTTGGGGQEVDPVAGTDLRWAELPSNFESPSADQFVHTTWTTTVTSGRRVRNYTYCYDTRRHNPVWVAYPHHRCYMEGSGRSDEPWAADPALPESQQSKIYASSTGDMYQYWTADLVTGAYGSGYWSRGHLCMSRERPGKGLEINMQTFRPTNVAPQASEPSAFGKIWGNIEEAISGGTIPADTLYIVAGCYYENDNNWKEKDASNNGALSSLSKDCVMPTRQFKMAVRKKTVQVGKPIQECTADELETIAFWVESLTKSTATDKSQLDQFIVPISEIETAMGMKFFPGIPDAAKSRKGTLSAWY
ncbi:DNA/RNA non-specific endonuclease [uncultured Alistipes sp.]|uniref:DNA/RNA non-specific endonuclease n=1 Tax=uncultured Alistipes sp. TaxID=538949 RepID=UPI0025861CF2|nr:DNA/RNA non-specific endonuclease [uncultured Alistipes sp.]